MLSPTVYASNPLVIIIIIVYPPTPPHTLLTSNNEAQDQNLELNSSENSKSSLMSNGLIPIILQFIQLEDDQKGKITICESNNALFCIFDITTIAYIYIYLYISTDF